MFCKIKADTGDLRDEEKRSCAVHFAKVQPISSSVSKEKAARNLFFLVDLFQWHR
jgi:hypothetical protein